MKTLIGFGTFGNLGFTKLLVRGIRETATEPVEMFAIVGKPDDHATAQWLEEQGIAHRHHATNKGFPASINDLYDHAFKRGVFDNLIIAGNDVVPYPGAIDEMIRLAAEGEWEWICASQFDAHSLVARYPEARKFFHGDNLTFTDFEARPWELHEPTRLAELASGRDVIERDCIKDVRNLALFTRASFEKIGYDDVNFWPGGYFADNDYCYRARLAGIRACGLPRAAYFHFWSRTIHQEGGSTTARHFERNRGFYVQKWGGEFNAELWTVPFNGREHELGAVDLASDGAIRGRILEPAIIEHWRNAR
jgi:GT2 family glycosyltransferase